MSRLDRIQSWPEMAQKSGWCVAALAKQCGVSMRTLELYFGETMGRSPKSWLIELRQRQAVKLLNQRLPVKEIAAQLGYKHATHFSREFKKHWSVCPTEFNSNRPKAGERRTQV